jgi:hypothetical protein
MACMGQCHRNPLLACGKRLADNIADANTC